MQGAVDRPTRLAEPLRFMRASSRRPRRRWVLLLAAAVALLPPGAWSLCLDRAGHLAIEPTSWPCDESPVDGSPGAPECGTASHDGCEDYVLLQGQITTIRDSQSLATFAQALATMPVGLARALPPTSGRTLAALRAHAPPPRPAPTILRC